MGDTMLRHGKRQMIWATSENNAPQMMWTWYSSDA